MEYFNHRGCCSRHVWTKIAAIQHRPSRLWQSLTYARIVSWCFERKMIGQYLKMSHLTSDNSTQDVLFFLLLFQPPAKLNQDLLHCHRQVYEMCFLALGYLFGGQIPNMQILYISIYMLCEDNYHGNSMTENIWFSFPQGLLLYFQNSMGKPFFLERFLRYFCSKVAQKFAYKPVPCLKWQSPTKAPPFGFKGNKIKRKFHRLEKKIALSAW